MFTRIIFCATVLLGLCAGAGDALAATLRLSPATGVYSAGGTVTVVVGVNTAGEAINAAEGTLRFNPKEVSVVAVNRSNSIFSLWVTEPTFSNSAGTVNFSGGSPAGYTGSGGTVMTVTFRFLAAGSPRVDFSAGAVLANDGKGTNVLTAMNGASFTVGAVTNSPTPEVVEYIAPANTPKAPSITSTTHSDERLWYKARTAELSWTLPPGVVAVRTLLDTRSSSIPTKVYEEPLRSITLSDLPQGVSYFHLQFQNADGWGGVAHYRLAVDSEPPREFSAAVPDDVDRGNPEQVLKINVSDETSKITRYKLKVDDGDYVELIDPEETRLLKLPAVSPGYHTVLLEALDEAGNSALTTTSFTVEAFTAPTFTEYPASLGENIIPVLRGSTRPSSTVVVMIGKIGAEPDQYTVIADATGTFTVIPNAAFSAGVYEVTAIATDVRGAQSEPSSAIRIAVQEPGFVRVGSLLVSVVSLIVTLVSLCVVTVLLGGYFFRAWREVRLQVRRESKEATATVRREFITLDELLDEYEKSLHMRRGKESLSSEKMLIENLRTALRDAERRVEKEVVDVELVIDGKVKNKKNKTK
jgi:Bacterial Ig-like domain